MHIHGKCVTSRSNYRVELYQEAQGAEDYLALTIAVVDNALDSDCMSIE